MPTLSSKSHQVASYARGKENVCVKIMGYFTARFGGKSSKRFACNMKCQASVRVTVSSRMTGDQLI